MKRARDGTPLVPPSDHPVQVQPPTRMDLKPAATDAFAYIAAVKDQLQGEPDKYQELINTLLEYFRANRIDKNSMLSRVKVLLAGCPELILGFNEFLSTSRALNIHIQEDKRQRQEDKKMI